MAGLQRLSLRNNTIRDEGAQALAATEVWSQLRCLDVADNHLNSDSLVALVQGPGLARLEQLVAWDRDPTDHEAHAAQPAAWPATVLFGWGHPCLQVVSAGRWLERWHQAGGVTAPPKPPEMTWDLWIDPLLDASWFEAAYHLRESRSVYVVALPDTLTRGGYLCVADRAGLGRILRALSPAPIDLTWGPARGGRVLAIDEGTVVADVPFDLHSVVQWRLGGWSVLSELPHGQRQALQTDVSPIRRVRLDAAGLLAALPVLHGPALAPGEGVIVPRTMGWEEAFGLGWPSERHPERVVFVHGIYRPSDRSAAGGSFRPLTPDFWGLSAGLPNS